MAVLMRHKNTIFGLNSDLAGLQLADANEITARQAADATLQSNIDAEAARAVAAEGVLQSNIDAEAATRQSNDTTLQSNIDAEAARAVAAEGVLTTNLNTEKSRALAAEGVLQSNIDAEAARAVAAEGVLQSGLSAEVSRATAAEGVLQSNIDAEVADRQAGDVALDARLDIIEAGLMAGVFWKASFDTLADLESALSVVEGATEAGWAYYVKESNDGYVVVDENDGDYIPATWSAKSLIKFADYTEVSGLVNAEKARAIAAESTLTSNLNTEISRATAAEGVLTSDLSAEVSRATAAEGVLTSGLSTEVSRAIAAEGVIASDLVSEVSRATAAESTLTSNLNTEIATRISEDALNLKIASNLSDLANVGSARTNLDVYSKSEVTNAIAQGGAEGIIESLTVNSDKVVLSYKPKNGMILNFATARHVDSNLVSWDIPVVVDPTDVSGKTFVLSPDSTGQFDGKSVLIQYYYVNL